MSKRQQDIIAAERMEQVREKSARVASQAAEERMWAQLWDADMRAKAEREEDKEKQKIRLFSN